MNIIFLALCLTKNLSGQTNQTSFSQTLGSIASGASSLPQQFAQGFGYCPSDYTYSMNVWNDLPIPLDAYIQSIVNVQGAHFNSKTAGKALGIQPYSSTQDSALADVHVCGANVKLDANGKEILHRTLDAIDKDDNQTYFYHSYNLEGTYNGEFLGPGMYGGPYATSEEFDGVFFNNTSNDAPFSFNKNGNTYKITLEPESFNLLSSDSTIIDSIRSSSADRKFSFTLGNSTVELPVTKEGLASLYYDTASSTTTSIPLTMTYEIYPTSTGSNIGIQGFNMGNHNQIGILDLASSDTPTQNDIAPIRDINPVSCSLWLQSSEQYQQLITDSTIIAYTQPGSVWAVYQTNDQKVYKQISSGKVTTFNVIRPQVSETSTLLAVFALDTLDAKKAQQFLQTIVEKAEIPLPTTAWLSSVTASTTQSLSIAVQKAIQSAPQGTDGIIKDPASGVTGNLLLVDIFIPYGGGTETPRYYEIPPALLYANSSFASIFTSNLDPNSYGTSDSSSTNDKMTADFQKNVGAWLTTFAQNSKTTSLKGINLSNAQSNSKSLLGLVPDLTSWLQSKGASALFTDSTKANFSKQGLQSLYLMLAGPVSLKSPPLLRQAGNNVYLGLQPGTRPSGWPSEKNN